MNRRRGATERMHITEEELAFRGIHNENRFPVKAVFFKEDLAERKMSETKNGK
ncbi:hypothetical protein MY11210_002604 [Beauveria gryllotalpidicola]